MSRKTDIIDLTKLKSRFVHSFNEQANKETRLEMTLVSVFYDAGINPLRKEATKKAVNCWMKQKHLPSEIMFIEMGFNGTFTFSEEDFPKKIKYIRIDATDRHKYLFQKEHLWNIALKKAKYEKMMFADSDMSPVEDIDWFKCVYDSLDNCIFTQGFNLLSYLDEYDKKTDMVRTSFYNKFLSKADGISTPDNPGGVYCIRRSFLKKIGGFNFLPLGGGDALFQAELSGQDQNPYILLQKRESVRETAVKLSKELGIKIYGQVPVEIFHFFHGGREGRSYLQRHYLMMTQFPWMNTILKDDEKGLLAWVDESHYFHEVVARFKEINDIPQNAHELMKDNFDYLNFYLEFRQSYNEKNRFEKKDKHDIINLIQHLQKRYGGKQERKGRDFDVVVSFTTYAERFMRNEFYDFLDSIIFQKCHGIRFRIVCTLCRKDHQLMNERMKRYFQQNCIEVLVTQEDFKPHKKYIRSMQTYKDYPVILVDDDAIYTDDMVSVLYMNHLKTPEFILGHRVRKIEFYSSGYAKKYATWKFINEKNEPSVDFLATSGGGTLFPPNFCKLIDDTIPEKIEQTGTLFCDDFFLHYLAQCNGIKTKSIEYNKTKLKNGFMQEEIFALSRNKHALWWNKNNFDNDNHIHLFDKTDKPRPKVLYVVQSRFFIRKFEGYGNVNVLDGEFLKTQAEIMVNNLFRSLNNQTNMNFEVVLLMNPELRYDIMYAVQKIIISSNPRFKISFVPYSQRLHDYVQQNWSKYDYVVMTRVDLDDFVNRDVVQDVYDTILENKVQDVVVCGYRNGYMLFDGKEKKMFKQGVQWEHGHMSIFQSIICNTSNVREYTKAAWPYSYNHTKYDIQKLKNKFPKFKFLTFDRKDGYIWYRHQDAISLNSSMQFSMGEVKLDEKMKQELMDKFAFNVDR